MFYCVIASLTIRLMVNGASNNMPSLHHNIIKMTWPLNGDTGQCLSNTGDDNTNIRSDIVVESSSRTP